MSRVIHESGDVRSEPFSPTTELQWVPGTLDGQVVFRPERIATVNGKLFARTPERELIVPFSDALSRLYPVTLPDGTQTELPGTVAMQIIRAAFAHFYDERAAAEVAAAEVVVEPAPEPQSLPNPEAAE